MKKIAIIGASDFQNPLILKAKEKGFETHVFAWECGDIGEQTADFFYPISITECDEILEKCQEIGIDAVATIASDLANIAVAYVAENMGLCANSIDCVYKSTNKTAMRKVFESNGDPSPFSCTVDSETDLATLDIEYPAIVKPSDRSGSRGVTKLLSADGLEVAIERAIKESFSKTALIEGFVDGAEYSVEFISWKGEHHFLSITEKFTSGAPHFIEKGHLEPARLTSEQKEEIKAVVKHALDGLGVEYGASHSELKINSQGKIQIIEIGSRMGGDLIGSDLVKLSTGYDFLDAVIDVASGIAPKANFANEKKQAAIRFVFSQNDLEILKQIKNDTNVDLIFESSIQPFDHEIVDSGSRYGYYLFVGNSLSDIEKYLPCD